MGMEAYLEKLKAEMEGRLGYKIEIYVFHGEGDFET